jgi:L-cysteine/cystine lyase
VAKRDKAKAASDGAKLAAIRANMPATTTTGYFNAGTNGPLTRIAVDALTTAAQSELERGRIVPGLSDGVFEVLRSTRATFASLINARPTEIALMRSTTEGMNAALMGIDWQRGDEVITTQLEHSCLFSLLGLVSHRHGVTVKTVDIGNGGDDVLAAIMAATTRRTRAIAFSHVQWSSGAVMPVKEIAAFARERGIITMIDAAQSAGQIEIDVDDLGVDAYAMAGQKWLCGPGGTGALFVRNDRLGDIRPTYIRYGTFDPHGFIVPPEGSSRFEMGEMYNPSIRALNAGLTWIRDDVTLPWVYARVSSLANRLAAGLAKIDRVTVTTPLDKMAGLVCFTVDGRHPKEVSDATHQRGFTIRSVDQRPGPTIARASTGWWCTEDEVDGLIVAIEEIAASTTA